MNYVVLIGPPATGKSTLAIKLKESLLNSTIFSFDDEYPLEVMIQNEDKKNSKDFRMEFIEIIQRNSSTFDWILIEDTCHLKSMQKRYIKLESENEIIKVLFLYLSARNDQIPELKKRNLNRSTAVKCEEIENITKLMNSSELITTNLIEFNFENVPEIDELIENIKFALDNYKFKYIEPAITKDIESDSNYFNKLNMELNKEISRAFKLNVVENGAEISKQKKLFLSAVRQGKNDLEIDELIEEFRIKYLH